MSRKAFSPCLLLARRIARRPISQLAATAMVVREPSRPATRQRSATLSSTRMGIATELLFREHVARRGRGRVHNFWLFNRWRRKKTHSDECTVYRFTILKIFVVLFLVFCRYKGTKGRHKYQAGIAERLFVSASKRDCYNLAQHRAARLTTFDSRRRLEHPSTQILPD
jgi:hypothetical protein